MENSLRIFLISFSLLVFPFFQAFCQEQEEKAWVKCYATDLASFPVDFNKYSDKHNVRYVDTRSPMLLHVTGTDGEEVKAELRRYRNHPDDCSIELDGFAPGNYVFRLENTSLTILIMRELDYSAAAGKGGASLLVLEPGKNYVIFCHNYYVVWGSVHGYFDPIQHEQFLQSVIFDYLLQNESVTRDERGNWFIDGRKATLRRNAEFFILNVPNILS